MFGLTFIKYMINFFSHTWYIFCICFSYTCEILSLYIFNILQMLDQYFFIILCNFFIFLFRIFESIYKNKKQSKKKKHEKKVWPPARLIRPISLSPWTRVHRVFLKARHRGARRCVYSSYLWVLSAVVLFGASGTD